MNHLARSRVREALRAQINGEHQLHCIQRIVELLTGGVETVQGAPVPLDSSRVAALKAALDAHFKLLDRVLPALKAIELSGEDGQPLPVGSSDRLVLATKLLALMREEAPEAAQEPRLPPFLS